MRPPLVIAVSPYHLTTREPPAMAAVLLADKVVTLLPAPASGRSRDDVARAVERSPRYLRLMESWRWTMPLWNEGVVASSLDDSDVADDLRSLYERIEEDDDLADLRPLTRHASEATSDEFLDLLSADILKGGPDPGLNIPVGAVIDAFAVRQHIVVARAAAVSVAQRAEAKLGRRAFSVAAPIVTHASAKVILELRSHLSRELDALRDAIIHSVVGAGAPQGVGPDHLDALSRASERLTTAFAGATADLIGHDDDEGIRIMDGYVAITAMILPADVTIRSGLAAARSMQMRGIHINGGGALPTSAQAPGDPLVTLVFKQLSARPVAR